MLCAVGASRSTSMLDILLLALGLAFFAAAIGYTYACERL
jgi:ABC-type antimicrobial peptide transport system permease subunit